MKPRVNIAQTTQPDGANLVLQEHDGCHSLMVDDVVTAGRATRVSEAGLARLATSPFRPVRQPRIWIAGLGLGAVLAAAEEALLQKRGLFHVAEPCPELLNWHRQHLNPTWLDDPRAEIGNDVGPSGFGKETAVWHAILLHADTAPLLDRKRLLFEDRQWLGAAFEALKPGGLLAIASARPVPRVESTLGRAGFEVVRHEIEAAPNARRPRSHFLWLARKGDFTEQ